MHKSSIPMFIIMVCIMENEIMLIIMWWIIFKYLFLVCMFHHIQCMNMLNIKPCYKNSKATNYDENYTRLKYLPINGSPLANDLITDYYIKKKGKSCLWTNPQISHLYGRENCARSCCMLLIYDVQPNSFKFYRCYCTYLKWVSRLHYHHHHHHQVETIFKMLYWNFNGYMEDWTTPHK